MLNKSHKPLHKTKRAKIFISYLVASSSLLLLNLPALTPPFGIRTWLVTRMFVQPDINDAIIIAEPASVNFFGQSWDFPFLLRAFQ